MRRILAVSLCLCFITSGFAFADCPSADVSGDCRVDLEDFVIMASQWLDEGVPEDPNNLTWVYINDPGVPGHEAFNGEMSKYETTNAQYCQFLNAALASGDIYVSTYRVYGSNGSNSGEDFVDETYFMAYEGVGDSWSQITYSGGVFSVRIRDGYDMSNHPVVGVNWYGATAFCNYYGYKLPTEWEWEAVADHEGEFNYGCGTSIDHTKANYDEDNPLDLSQPYTSPVDHYSSYGYGMNDMAGNMVEWTDSIESGDFHILRGGSWESDGNHCSVGNRGCSASSGVMFKDIGFRVCRPERNNMTYIPGGEFEMGDHHGDGYPGELPVHAVLLDSFYMGRYEITNQQYCGYVNSAYPAQIKVDNGVVYASSDSSNSYPYCSTSSAPTGFPDWGEYSQIDHNDVSGTFSVRTKGVSNRDMSNDPMVMVSWYGAVAYCNWRSSEEGYESCYDYSDPNWPCDFSKHGYRLPTEAGWEYAARGGEQSPYYRFPWGDTISHSQANYWSIWEEGSPFSSYDVSPTEGFHPTWNDGIYYPYTSPVGFFDGALKYKSDYNWPGSATSYQTTSGANGYGLYDMAGNVIEWCNDWHDSDYYDTSPYDNPQGPASGTGRVLRAGGWVGNAHHGRVSSRITSNAPPTYRHRSIGFRIVLDLE